MMSTPSRTRQPVEREMDNRITAGGLSTQQISSIESKSSHPMASALVDHAHSKSIELKPEKVSEFQIFYPGEGVYGEVDSKKIHIGNKRIVARAGCDSDPNLEDEGMKEAVTLGYVFSGAMLIGTFALSDSCRTGAAEAIQELKSLGVRIVMLTGDSTAAALHANNQLGQVIEVVHAGLLPEDKVRIINELKTKEGPTTMVGDGMNDAPALAAANVGISMGISGSAVAMETSHINCNARARLTQGSYPPPLQGFYSPPPLHSSYPMQGFLPPPSLHALYPLQGFLVLLSRCTCTTNIGQGTNYHLANTSTSLLNNRMMRGYFMSQVTSLKILCTVVMQVALVEVSVSLKELDMIFIYLNADLV